MLERDSEARSDRVGAVNPSHAEDDADKGLHMETGEGKPLRV